MKLNFAKGQWNQEEVTYAYSFRFKETPVFVQEDDCIANRKDESFSQGYDNVSLMSKKAYAPGAKISAECLFESFGAPLFVIADALHPCEDGCLRYGDYMEVVLYEKGINVWRMWRKDGKVSWVKLLGAEFPVEANEKHEFSTLVTETGLVIEAKGQKLTLRIDDMYPSFHLGINACEGINKFYHMEIEEA